MIMADQGGGNNVIRDYRKGNWTEGETMVLIEAKKMDDERRTLKRTGDSEGRNKPTELRWKWVEDYCWRKGCFRSQNQCNDKWDNLMRDYKKVRDYERKIAEREGGNEEGLLSYWKLEKNERKGKNLPTNMLFEIYEALAEAVERRGGEGRSSSASAQRIKMGPSSASGSTDPSLSYGVERPILTSAVQISPVTPIVKQHHHHQVYCASPAALPLPPPPPSSPPPPPPLSQPPALSLPHSHQPFTTVDSDTSEFSDSPSKRRRRSSAGGKGVRIGGEGTSTGTATANTSNEVGAAISKSASIIAEALHACDKREERRHKDLLSLHEKRLVIEESKTEINRQGINGLVDAINNLAGSILALTSNNSQSSK